MRRIILALAGAAIAFASISCSSSADAVKVSALVTADGRPAAFIVKYKTEIDGSSVNKSTYKVTGEEISKVFVSGVNPFEGKTSTAVKGGSKPKDGTGQYIVVFLKDKKPSEGEAVVGEIRQASTITTSKGKAVHPWKKAIRAEEAFPVQGGRTR